MNVEVKRVCVATDFSESAARAFEYGAALSDSHGAELHVLHVLTDFGAAAGGGDHRLCFEMAREYFNRLRRRADAPGSPTETAVATEEAPVPGVLGSLESRAQQQFAALAASGGGRRNFVQAIRFGNPVEEIVHYVHRHGIDLLVVGTHGRTGMTRVLAGSVSERLVRVNPCTVLIVGGRLKQAAQTQES